MRLNYTTDELLELKDAGAVTSSGAATVDSVAKIIDVGAGFVEGKFVIDISAIETDGSAAQGTLTVDTTPTGAVASQGTLTVDTTPTGAVASQGTLSLPTQPTPVTASQGTLTVDTNPVGAVASQGTLTMDTNPVDANNDTVTIGAVTYRFKDSPSQAEDICIGIDVAATQARLVKAINGTGTVGADYFAGTTAPHPTVSAGNFALNACVLTARTKGAAGDTIATTETFNAGSNIFDGVTLGTTTAGVDGDTMTIDAKTYTFEAVLSNVDGNIEVGAAAVNTQENIVNAINLTGTPGTGYAALMTVHPTVSIGNFAANAAVLTAKTPGAAGDTIATTETFTAGTNVFDGVNLGTTTAGKDADTMTIGAKTYAFQANGSLTNVNGNIEIGGDLATTQANIVNAINLTGTPGTGYAAAMTLHPTVSIADFAANDAVLTAKTKGVAGDTIVSTETFDAVGNIFDGVTLGTTRAGVTGDTMTIGAKTYTFDSNGALENVDGHIEVGTGGTALADTQENIVNAITLGGTPGTGYATLMTVHPTVTIAAFDTNAAVVTAKTKGAAGDTIGTTETFAAGTNIFDGVTLGTTRAGVTGDTMTVDAKTYTFDSNGALENVDGHIEVGTGGTALADTQENIVNAINLSGTPGTGYAALMTEHPTVSIADFATNAAVLTAKTKDADTDSIVTTETFAAGTNIFDAATLGATRAGADGDERYDIVLQGSNSSTFASGVVDLASVAVGASASINMSASTSTGRHVLPFLNWFMGTVYRYLRAYTVVAGVHVSTGINYSARLAKD